MACMEVNIFLKFCYNSDSVHTCDKFQKGIREIFFSFQGGLSKMYRIYRKILNSDEGDFKILVKSCVF